MTKPVVRKNLFPNVWNTREEFITPFSSMFDKMIEQHFPEFKQDFGVNFSKGSYPKVDVIDRRDTIEIIAELAGWKREDIQLTLENGLLTISGKAAEAKQEEGTYLLRELKRSSFTRSFQVSEKLDEDRIVASFNNGILVIKIGKLFAREENEKVSIPIGE